MLEELIGRKLRETDPALLEPFFSDLKNGAGVRADAVIGYGSCLSQVTRSATSAPDFFLLVPGYRSFYKKPLHALLNCVLPPNIYHFRIERRTAKFNVISYRALARHTSKSAKDAYVMGRFSKRLALLWARNERAEKAVVEAQAQAMRSVGARALFLLPTVFTAEEFAKECLRLSYLGDVRVEAKDKVDRLFDAEREFYLAAYGAILGEMGLENSGEAFSKPRRPWRDAWGRFSLKWFILSSQTRAQLRWPKGIFTVDNWLDYILEKIERTQGIRVDLTPREKKYWYIYGWKHFIALRRRNLIK